MNWFKAQALFATARNKDAGKPLENNTRLFQRGEDYAVRLHSTDVVTIHRDGTWTLNTGGWYTLTTKARINEYSPARVSQRQGIWYCGGNLFHDGMKVREDGSALDKPADPAPLEAAMRKVDKLVREYIKGYVEHIRAGKLEQPGGGDCWGCYFQAQGTSDPMGIDHYFEHFKERYYVPSILWKALQRRGNPAFCWQLIMDGHADMAAHDLRTFFRDRKLALAKSLI